MSSRGLTGRSSNHRSAVERQHQDWRLLDAPLEAGHGTRPIHLERISFALNHLPRRRRACPGDPEFLSTERQQSRWPGQARSRLEREVRRSNPTGIRANRPQFPYLAWSHAMTPRGEVLANKATRDRLLPLSQL